MATDTEPTTVDLAKAIDDARAELQAKQEELTAAQTAHKTAQDAVDDANAALAEHLGYSAHTEPDESSEPRKISRDDYDAVVRWVGQQAQSVKAAEIAGHFKFEPGNSMTYHLRRLTGESGKADARLVKHPNGTGTTYTAK